MIAEPPLDGGVKVTRTVWLACRAALYFVEQLQGGLLAHVARVGAYLEHRLRAVASRHDFVKEVRGAGLIWGLELTRDAGPVVPLGLARGVVVNRTADKVVRLLPPYVIEEAEIDEAVGRLDAALSDLGASA